MYTNGFNIDKVLGALSGRVGWRQPTLAGSPTLSAANTKSDSKRCFQDFHAIATPQNIKDTQEDEFISDSDFNTYLLNLQKAAILKSLNGVFNKRELLERKLLFERYGRQDYIETGTGKFVGIRILPARDFGITCQIDQVALYFDSAITFNLYLFHDAIKAPIWTQSITTEAGKQTLVSIPDPDCYLNYSENNKGGCFYLGYFQDDINAQGAHAINEIVEQFNSFYNFGMVPCEMPRIAGQYNMDRNNVSFTIKTHGLNLQMMAFRDHTQRVVNNPGLFDELIGLQMAADVIELIQNSIRTNKNERITKELSGRLYNDLNLAMSTEEFPYSTGLKNRIQRELGRVKKELFPPCKIESTNYDSDSIDVYGVRGIDVFKY
jgi:hypothetical protein